MTVYTLSRKLFVLLMVKDFVMNLKHSLHIRDCSTAISVAHESPCLSLGHDLFGAVVDASRHSHFQVLL